MALNVSKFPILRLEIAEKLSVKVSDPTSMLMELVMGTYDARDGVADENWSSMISGKPALQYRSNDMVAELTPDEMDRFLRRDLTPDEYFALRMFFPKRSHNFHSEVFHPEDFFEIHDDFYDPKTGEAFQPVFRRMA